MIEKAKSRSPAIEPEHAKAEPSVGDRANVAVFDHALKTLAATSEEARPRRWITRIGTLLRQVRMLRKVGQEIVAEKASVTQPYLSRLENGGLPKHGPTIDVLFRCAEALGCDIEVSMRSKSSGDLLGSVSSADLSLTGVQLSHMTLEIPEAEAPQLHGHVRVGHSQMVNLVVKPKAKSQKMVVWVGMPTPDGSFAIKTTSLDAEDSVASVIKRHTAPRGRVQVHLGNVVTKAEPQTVNVGEGDVVVIGSST